MIAVKSEHDDLLGVKHVMILKSFLRAYGAFPSEVFGKKLPLFDAVMRKESLIQTFFFAMGQYYYIVDKWSDLEFFEIGEMLLTIFLAAVTFARTVLPNLSAYLEVSKLFFLEFHLYNFKERGGYFETMYYKVDKICNNFARFVMTMMVFGLVLYNISPQYSNYVTGAYSSYRSDNVTFFFSVYFKFPGFEQNNHFVLCTIINFYLCWLTAICFCAIDLLLCIMVLQIIAHIKILNYNIQHLSDIDCISGIFTDEENEVIHQRIKGFVDHHLVIVKFVETMSSFFGPFLALNYAFHLVSCCLLLLECSSLSLAALVRYGPLTVIIFGQLILISVTFEVVSTEAEKLSHVVYSAPWEKMSVQNQVSICIILRRFQKPLSVTAMGIVEVSIRTMASILKTTFSYFTFLSSLS